MRRYALIGYPIAGSQSPALFASAGIPGSYELFENPDFEAAWEAFLRDYDAVNVTAPFKEKAFSRADILSPRALRCGAVNLLRKGSDGKVRGFNTDVDGVLYALSGIPASGEALVVGNGGAARAAVVALQEKGMEVALAGRNPLKVEAVAASLGCRGISLADATGMHPSLVVYTLPPEAPVPVSLPFADAVVLEAEYRRPSLRDIPCRKYISGLEWLKGQSLTGFSLFSCRLG